MSKEDFRKLLSQWANEDVYIGQLTWEEGDALAERLANWHASQHLRAPDAGESAAQQALFTPEADSAAGKLPTPTQRR